MKLTKDDARRIEDDVRKVEFRIDAKISEYERLYERTYLEKLKEKIDIRLKALAAFTDLVAHADTRYIVVSYNNTYNSKSGSSKNKITLEQIEEVLNQCGETNVFTHKHNAFNAGKTKFDDHKEYLFITKVDNERRNRSFATLLRG